MEPLNKLGKVPPDPIEKFVRNKKKDLKNKIEKIRVLVSKTISHFNDIKHEIFVVNPSIPILYFGDLIKYLKSDLKIVTAAINPSDKEFNQKRFSFMPDNLKQNDALSVIDSLNNYFDYNPYDGWFNMQTENIMNQLGTSYYSNKGFKNTSLHTDICSPIATDPTWGGLKKKQKSLLEKKGFEIWLDLIKILKPDIILISVGKDYLKSNNFVEVSKLKIDKNINTTFNFDNITNKEKVNVLANKDIDFYTNESLKNIKIYKGINRGLMFAYIEKKEAKIVADLILKHMKE